MFVYSVIEDPDSEIKLKWFVITQTIQDVVKLFNTIEIY